MVGSGRKKYCVTLYPEDCQSPSTGTCYHIMAARMAIGLTDSDDKKFITYLNSTEMRGGADKKSGKKKPKLDEEVVIVLAPDSTILNNNSLSE